MEGYQNAKDYQDMESILAGLVRVGFVTDVNREKRLARVKFPDTNKTSDWMSVLINRDYFPDQETTPQKTETKVGGGSIPEHYHELKISPWMPKVNDTVLVLCLPVRNGDGFILGGIQPWR